jgi:hypothetical protein
MFNPEAREARAMLEAYRRRATSGGDLDQLYHEVMAGMAAMTPEQEAAEDALDEWAWNAPRMTPGQLARIRRLATAPGDPAAAAS